MVADTMKASQYASRRGLSVRAVDAKFCVDVLSYGIWQRLRMDFLMYPFDAYYPELNACKSELQKALNVLAAWRGR